MFPDFSREVHCLLGLPFDAVDLKAAEQRIRTAIATRSPCFLSTPNLNFVIASQSDSAFRDSVINSDLSVADGMPIVWLARILGIPIKGRVAGSTLFDALRSASGSPLSVFFFGGPKGVAEMACRRLTIEGRGMTCAGFESPGFGSIDEMSNEESIRRINSSNADFLVVSLGARKGQAWIERNRDRISVPVISHLGAVLNFVAGTVKRAPLWMQNIGLEWMWRIKEDPVLWRRYYKDGLALINLLVGRVLPYAWYLFWHKANGRQPALASAETKEEAEYYTIRLFGAWKQECMAPLRHHFYKAVAAGKEVRLEMHDVTYVDSAFVGLAMLLHGHLTRHRRQLSLVSVSLTVRRIFRLCGAEYLCHSISSSLGQ